MRFKRISTDTVRCIVTREELNDNGLEMDDFMSNNGKTEDFLRRMLAVAEQEVGFQVRGGPLTIQVAVLGDRLALTFSEKQTDDYGSLLECLRSAVSSLSNAVNEKLGQKDAGQQEQGKKAGKDSVYLLEFDGMQALQTFCCGLEPELEEHMQMDSELYYLEREGSYGLVIHRGSMDENQLCRIVSSSMEYMSDTSAHEGQIAYLREHGRCMCADHAITRLQSVFRH